MAKSKEKIKVARRNPEQMTEALVEICDKFFKKGRCKIDTDNFLFLSGYKRLPADYLDDVYALLIDEDIVLCDLEDYILFIKRVACDSAFELTKARLKKVV